MWNYFKTFKGVRVLQPHLIVKLSVYQPLKFPFPASTVMYIAAYKRTCWKH